MPPHLCPARRGPRHQPSHRQQLPPPAQLPPARRSAPATSTAPRSLAPPMYPSSVARKVASSWSRRRATTPATTSAALAGAGGAPPCSPPAPRATAGRSRAGRARPVAVGLPYLLHARSKRLARRLRSHLDAALRAMQGPAARETSRPHDSPQRQAAPSAPSTSCAAASSHSSRATSWIISSMAVALASTCLSTARQGSRRREAGRGLGVQAPGRQRRPAARQAARCAAVAAARAEPTIIASGTHTPHLHMDCMHAWRPASGRCA